MATNAKRFALLNLLSLRPSSANFPFRQVLAVGGPNAVEPENAAIAELRRQAAMAGQTRCLDAGVQSPAPHIGRAIRRL